MTPASYGTGNDHRGDGVAAVMLAARTPGREYTEATTVDGILVRFRWMRTVEIRNPRQPSSAFLHRGTVVELDCVDHVHDQYEPADDAPGLRWWIHGSIDAPRPYRIDIVEDDDLDAAVRLLLSTARHTKETR